MPIRTTIRRLATICLLLAVAVIGIGCESKVTKESFAQIKNGMTLQLEGGLFQVVEFQHVKPGKGGAFVRTTLKNVRTGAVVDKTFRAAEKVEQARLDKREMQYLYRDGGDFVFMDNASYEQLNVPAPVLGSAANFLVEGMTAILQMFGDDGGGRADSLVHGGDRRAVDHRHGQQGHVPNHPAGDPVQQHGPGSDDDGPHHQRGGERW